MKVSTRTFPGFFQGFSRGAPQHHHRPPSLKANSARVAQCLAVKVSYAWDSVPSLGKAHLYGVGCNDLHPMEIGVVRDGRIEVAQCSNIDSVAEWSKALR